IQEPEKGNHQNRHCADCTDQGIAGPPELVAITAPLCSSAHGCNLAREQHEAARAKQGARPGAIRPVAVPESRDQETEQSTGYEQPVHQLPPSAVVSSTAAEATGFHGFGQLNCALQPGGQEGNEEGQQIPDASETVATNGLRLADVSEAGHHLRNKGDGYGGDHPRLI